MRRIVFFKNISLIFGFVFIGCATNKGAEVAFSVSAIGVPQGIELQFYNIPKDTDYMVIGLLNNNIKDETASNIIILSAENNTLADVRESGKLLCPFAEKDDGYTITIYLNTSSGNEIDFKLEDVIAGGGIYKVNNPSLYFSNNNDTLVLSELPEFSQEVSFSENAFFDFNIYTKKTGEESFPDDAVLFGGGGERTSNLTSECVQETITRIKEGALEYHSINFEGERPIVGVVHCLLNYENFEWIVGVAQSEDAVVVF